MLFIFIVVEATQKWETRRDTSNGKTTTRSSVHRPNQVSDWTSALQDSLSYSASHGDTLCANYEGSLCGAETRVS